LGKRRTGEERKRDWWWYRVFVLLQRREGIRVETHRRKERRRIVGKGEGIGGGAVGGRERTFERKGTRRNRKRVE